MKIITISRQFGSGGRELGKRLADLLNWDYYDKEILASLAQEHDMDPNHVSHILSHHGWHSMQLTYRNSFSYLGFDHGARTKLLARQKEIIYEIAEAGNDCIIVGRDADILLREYNPLRIFVCADLPARISRCSAYEEKKPEAQRLSDKEIRHNIRRIDKSRARTREILTGQKHGDVSLFDLTVNTSGRNIGKLAAAVEAFAQNWFEE